MPMYIEVEDLKHITNNSKYYGTQELRDFLDMVYDTPTVDLVEVVRCKDCKYWDNSCGAERCCHESGGMWAKPNSFCSYGERREDE